jgi:uncharacterized protein YcbK (DUF882 family)
MYRRLSLAVLVLALVAWLQPSIASAAGGKGKPAAAAKKKSGGGKKKLVCTGKGKKRVCKRVPRVVITSRGVTKDELRQAPLARPSGHVHIWAPGHGEVEVDIFNPDGSYNMAALARLDAMWGCHRTKEVRAVDPRLYEIISHLNDTFGARVSLHSGFRYQQNEGSRHFHASAMDIKVEGVSWQEVAAFAETLDPGGMGIGRYPNMGFVHIDFRAPGERSTRWNDTSSGTNPRDPGKQPSRAWRRGPSS